MAKIIRFGEDVEGYSIPVLNEREIRAAAGLLFLAVLLSFIAVLYSKNFVPIKYVITLFLTDFSIRVFINPRFSPTLIIGRLIVRNQVPEYVGAPQKRYAWGIGVILSSLMFILLVVVNSISVITGITCLLCLIFLFFESVFGICLGCKVYRWIYKEKAQYCPGEVCDLKAKQEIQKTSWGQVLIVLLFIAYFILLRVFLDGSFHAKPFELFGGSKVKQEQTTTVPR
jgi:hypothetical protein